MDALLSPPIAFAHRGARAHAPENTLEAFALALKLGATGLESDVWLTADGVAVLDHDGLVRRGLRRIGIGSLDRADLPDHIPSLAELYAECGIDYELSLDVKDERALDAVMVAARAAGAEDRLWLCHPDWQVVAGWREGTKPARLVDSTRLKRMSDGPERRAADLAAAGIDAVNLHRADWTGGLTTLFHRFEVVCLGWDAQYERVIAELLAMGIDGVYSDHVDLMMEVVNRFQR